MLKKDKDLLKAKSIRLSDLKEEITKLNCKVIANNTTTNVDTALAHLNGICTTFMSNNTTASWFDWLNNMVTPVMAKEAVDGVMSSNCESTRIGNVVRVLFTKELAPINTARERLEAAEEELISVLMYSDPVFYTTLRFPRDSETSPKPSGTYQFPVQVAYLPRENF